MQETLSPPPTMSSSHQNGSHAPAPERARSACPICRSTQAVDKVSNVVRGGRGRLIWDDGEVAHYESELSRLLDEPPVPRVQSIVRAFAEFIPPLVVLALVLAGIGLLGMQSFVTISEGTLGVSRLIAIAWFGFVIPGVLLVRYIQERLEVKKERPIWMAARRRWTGLYYCSHDDLVFSQDASFTVTPTEMQTLLYETTAATFRVLNELQSSAGANRERAYR